MQASQGAAPPSASATEPESVIQVRDLRHSYDGKHYALDGVSFSVRKGEVFGLLGRNGAGKSTLIKVLTTLIRPTSGNLKIFGLDPAHDGRKIRSRIGVVQQAESFDFTTVEGNFNVYGVLWGVQKAERTKRREDLMKRFDLEGIRKRRFFDLSGGQKRRVQVAREMIHDMDILFLDEPTVGLDVLMRRDLLDSIKKQVKTGLTVVFTTHNLEEADYLCDRIAVMDSGKILAMDTVENLKSRYGGKKTVEVTVGGSDPDGFFKKLGEKLVDASLKVSGSSAVIMVGEPKDALSAIIELSQATGNQIEWLNIRKNTLEDVFISSVTKEES